MVSPYESLRLVGLHPRLVSYFSTIPSGCVGRGVGVFDVVGTPRRWLWPVLWVLGRQGVVFPYWGRDVAFTVTNRQTDAGLTATRTFQFASGPRSMTDLMTVRHGGLRDELGSRRRYCVYLEASVEGEALRLRSVRMWVRLGSIHVPIPGRVALTERWDDERGQQHVAVIITAPLIGRVYEYSGYFDYAVLAEGDDFVPAP